MAKLVRHPWYHFTNPFQGMIAWGIIPGIKGVFSWVCSCTVFIPLVVGLSSIPETETKKTGQVWLGSCLLSESLKVITHENETYTFQ